MLVNESIEELLRPKNREEIEKELNKVPINEKIFDISFIYSDLFYFLEDFSNEGADERIIVDILLNGKSGKDLKDIAKELIDDNDDFIEIILLYGPNPKLDTFLKSYYTIEKSNFNEILNNILIKNADSAKDVQSLIDTSGSMYDDYEDR